MGAPDSTGGQQDPAIKADIVYFETPGGGRVFSTGSIAWSGALLANGGDNGVSKVTENVLRAFCTRPGG
jgi:N,N-dimethylformamidase